MCVPGTSSIPTDGFVKQDRRGNPIEEQLIGGVVAVTANGSLNDSILAMPKLPLKYYQSEKGGVVMSWKYEPK